LTGRPEEGPNVMLLVAIAYTAMALVWYRAKTSRTTAGKK